MNVLPSRRLLGGLALAAPLFLLSPAAALAVDALLLIAALVDALLVPGRSELRVSRSSPSRVSHGSTTEVRLRVENASPRAVRVEVTDDLPEQWVREGPDVQSVRVDAGGQEAVAYRARAVARGVARLGAVHLRILGPLGLVWRQRSDERSDDVLVQPDVREVRRYRLLAHRNRLQEAGLRTVRLRGEGSAFESLRDYARGDDPRTVDWKASGRRGTLIVRQYEAERSQNVMIAIDAGRLMTEEIDGRARIDHALSAALLLADVASRSGDRVGAFVFADRVDLYLPPTRAPLARLTEAFARVEARLVEPDYPGAFSHLARELRRRSLLVLFTDVIDAHTSSALLAHLAAATRRHLPLAVALRNTVLEDAAVAPADADPAVYRRAAAEELLQARAHALHAMQRAGILVADARPREAVTAVVNRYLEVKRKGLL